MAAPSSRQMSALPRDGKHRHLRPQITGYTSKLRKNELGDTLSGTETILDRLRGYNTPPAARPLSKAQQYRKEHEDLHVSLEAMELARWRAKYAKNTTLTRYGRERAELRVPHRRPCFEPTPIYDDLARDARILAREKDRKPPEWLAMVRAEGRKQKRPLSARLGFRRKEAKAEVIERDSFGKRLPSKRPVSAPATGRKPGSLAYRIFGAGKVSKPAKQVDALQEHYEKHGEAYDKFQDARVEGGVKRKEQVAKSIFMGGWAT
jgi:hypothetical protein